VDALRLERDVTRNPLFQVMFAFQNTPMPPISMPGLRVSGFDLDNGTTAFDFALLVSEQGEGLITVLRYSTELFHAATARRLLEQLSFLAHEIVADPDTTVERLCDKLSHDDRWRREIKTKQRKKSNIKQLDEIARRRIRKASTQHIT
jgi:non-ribosomal peptide synthetase component F